MVKQIIEVRSTSEKLKVDDAVLQVGKANSARNYAVEIVNAGLFFFIN